MSSPPSKMLQQLRLSEQKEDLSQRQKPDRHRHKSTTGRRAVLTGAIVKAPTHAPQVRQTAVRAKKGHPEHFLIHTHPLDDPASYEREFSVMTTVSRIPALAHHAPRIIQADPSSGALVLRTPKLYWNPFYYTLESKKLGLEDLLALKQKLIHYVELLYGHGVAYRVKHEFVFPVRTTSGRWVLHLGGWMDAEFCSDPSHLESAEWKERKAKELDEIERMFELLVNRCKDIEDQRNGQPGHRCDKFALREQLRRQT